MSEYQYFEFQALDRPLTDKEMSALREYSTRARITRTSFVNEYSYGDFKGDEDAWMERYFDAFVHVANWGTHVLKLRVPAALLSLDDVKPYCAGNGLSARGKSGKTIISFVSEDEEAHEWVEGDGILSPLIPVRDALARGDLRALYLGWLGAVQMYEVDDDTVEPPVPPGLGQLDSSLHALAEFLRVDADLLSVAADASADGPSADADDGALRVWIAGLSTQDKDAALMRVIGGDSAGATAELLGRFRRRQGGPAVASPADRQRTVAELKRTAESRAGERIATEARKEADEQARLARTAARARAKHLDSIAGSEDTLWREVDALIATKAPRSYDAAIKLLVDLRDLDARAAGGAFGRRLEALRTDHARKGTLIERIVKAGL